MFLSTDYALAPRTTVLDVECFVVSGLLISVTKAETTLPGDAHKNWIRDQCSGTENEQDREMQAAVDETEIDEHLDVANRDETKQ